MIIPHHNEKLADAGLRPYTCGSYRANTFVKRLCFGLAGAHMFDGLGDLRDWSPFCFVRHDEGMMDTHSIVARAPVDCSKEEIGDFACLVRSGAEVQESGFENLIAKTFRHFFPIKAAALLR